jgi:uncharacterized damage-inducible protein DinB
MAEPLALSQVYAGWDRHNRLLAEAIAPLTPEQLAFKAGPQMGKIEQLVAHVVANRAFWFHDVMGEGDATFAAWSSFHDDNDHERPRTELLRGLSETQAAVETILGRLGPASLNDRFEERFQVLTGKHWNPVRSGTAATRRWIIWHTLEHDIHHGGEISLTLGMRGLPGLAL